VTFDKFRGLFDVGVGGIVYIGFGLAFLGTLGNSDSCCEKCDTKTTTERRLQSFRIFMSYMQLILTPSI
jgi:hypothetical protein